MHGYAGDATHLCSCAVKVGIIALTALFTVGTPTYDYKWFAALWKKLKVKIISPAVCGNLSSLEIPARLNKLLNLGRRLNKSLLHNGSMKNLKVGLCGYNTSFISLTHEILHEHGGKQAKDNQHGHKLDHRKTFSRLLSSSFFHLS
jgi:hypothetical protein